MIQLFQLPLLRLPSILCAATCQAAIEAVGKPAGSAYNPLVRSRVLRSHGWEAQAAMIDAAIPYWKEQPMPNREEVMTLLRQHYPYLAAQYGVKKIGLFGSYARDQSDETSDVDIIVEFERPLGFRFVELAEYLEHLLGRRVDVLTPTGVRGIRLPWVAEEIERSVIYV